MGKLAVYKYFSFMLLVITLLLAIFTLFGLFGGNANPAKSTALAMLVYILPFLIIGNGVMALIWLIRRRWHWMAIPVLTILCCIPYIGTIYQLGWFGSDQTSRNGIKIATYNVALFGRETTGFKAQDILAEMKKQSVDVLCLQEYLDDSGEMRNSDSYKDYFPYMATGRSDMVIYSRYPIDNHEVILFGNTNNSAMWADIDVLGKPIRVFNAHLETTGYNRTLHKAAKMQLQGQNVENNALLRSIYGTYMRGMVARAHQADTLAAAISESDIPVIVCGDFNDVPYSYVYNTVLGNLVDGFKECGKGFMYTMSGKKRVRIDYIFHDENLKGENYYREDLTYSDHYPVYMKISF
ncbi:MAG: endonuclease/exonuclease/phosphatase family protein [Prevotella sp.]|nr:endonuclease/exonuclease/phosphatase family protein [Prevotella sp.]